MNMLQAEILRLSIGKSLLFYFHDIFKAPQQGERSSFMQIKKEQPIQSDELFSWQGQPILRTGVANYFRAKI